MNGNKIADLSGVSPQQTFLESYPEKTPATSSLYIKRFTTNESDGSQSHTVVGMHIVLAKGNPNGLWDALHVDRSSQKLDPRNPQVAARSLQIYCDTLEIHGQLSVPEADVAIFARRLVWATPDAGINTSPLTWANSKAQNAGGTNPGENGAQGRSAGDLWLFVSEVEPASDQQIRLLAEGGPGQDPGAGLDGPQGTDMEHYYSYEFIGKDGLRTYKATVDFTPPAVYINSKWTLIGLKEAGEKIGQDAFPTSGIGALAPGKPGNGGDGGHLTTNLSALVPSFKNTGGKPGTKERDYYGGMPGEPKSSAKYKVQLKHNPFKKKTDYTVTTIDSHKTEPGANAVAQSAQEGSAPEAVIEGESNAWLHPLNLQKALEYARDLFLAGDRGGVQSLLSAYEAALAMPAPTSGAWDEGSAAQWVAAQCEVAAMLQRLRGHLDYFGNAAGYTPLLSLQGTIKLYEEETRRALRTLLLAGWINARERDAKDAAKALGEAINGLNEDIQQAAAQVASSEARISEVTGRIDALEQELNGMSNQLAILQNRLLSQAQNDLLQQAQIKFAIKMAAAVCQVVPVGQPVLGTVGSLAGVASDLIGGDGAAVPDTVSRMGEVLTKAREAAEKSKEASKKAEKEGDSAPAGDAKGAKASASAWAQVGKGLGPALSQVSQGLQALQVPQSEVEAELQRLESESQEWNTLVRDIRELNARKAAMVVDLVDALQTLGQGYGRISSNAAAVLVMHQERAKELGRLDPAATGFVQQMGQQSRLTLLRYLYIMVKAYETTVLKPIKVDWKLNEVTEKINELLKPDEGFDAARLDQQATVLEPLYQKNLDTVRSQLLNEFSFHEKTIVLQMCLSKLQTPEVLAALNKSGQVVVDPVSCGLVLPDYQLARLSHVALKEIEFDPAGPRLPESHNLLLSLQPACSGTIRKADALYSVYSDQPINWSWTYLAGDVRQSEPSKGAEDMLNLVLGSGAEKIKQKISLPPVWSDLAVNVAYSPELRVSQRPRITRLYFELGCDVTSAPDHQRVVNVQSLGLNGGAIVQCTPDLARRGAGFSSMIRIYERGSRVHLGVPTQAGGSRFDAWDLVGRQIDRIGVEQTEVDVKLDDHVLAQCHWSPSRVEAKPLKLSRAPSPAGIAKKAAGQEGEGAGVERKGVIRAASPARNLLIRAEASESGSVMGIAPALKDAELIEEGKSGWRLVNYRGIVGWVNAKV